MHNTIITTKQIVLILTLVLTTSLCYGREEHLEPAQDFKQHGGILKEYYDNVFPLLYKGYSEKPTARYTAIPSFSNEYSFSIETIKGKKYIVSNRLSENYWYAKNKKKVTLISSKTELTNDLYFKIVDLFKLLEKQTKNSKNSTVGLDGITFYFTTTNTDGQIKTGETWSPSSNSPIGKLIKFCDDIYAIGIGKNISQTEILKDANKLIKELKQ
ncbi:MAG TPA: hypothetical protein PLZ43_15085 [bacterium]|nr:hypothetical protein [bacterium]